MATRESGKRNRNLIIVGVVVLMCVFVCVTCFIVGILAPNEEPAQATVVAFPTATCVPETSMPSPVPTPVPTSAPTVDNTSNYREELHSLSAQYSEALAKVGELNRLMSNDLSLLTDSSWITDVGLALGPILILGEEIRALEPPLEYEEMHGYLIKATEHYDIFVSLYAEGVDTLDVSLALQAVEELRSGNDWLAKAAEAMP